MPSNPAELKQAADGTAKKSIPTRKVYGYYSVSTPLQPPEPLVESQGLGGTFISLTMHEVDAACSQGKKLSRRAAHRTIGRAAAETQHKRPGLSEV